MPSKAWRVQVLGEASRAVYKSLLAVRRRRTQTAEALEPPLAKQMAELCFAHLRKAQVRARFAPEGLGPKRLAFGQGPEICYC